VKGLVGLLEQHPRRNRRRFVFPPAGNREWHMLDKCRAISARAGLDASKFDLKTFPYYVRNADAPRRI
jgi:hypothetical protein